MRYLYGKLKEGPYICEGCGGIMDRKTVMELLFAELAREDMICNPCVYWEEHDPMEGYEEYDPDYSENEYDNNRYLYFDDMYD
jgi:hypothetical protein